MKRKIICTALAVLTMSLAVVGCGQVELTINSSAIPDRNNSVDGQKNITYEDMYNQAKDEEYWNDIPDTDSDELEYEIIDDEKLLESLNVDISTEPIRITGYIGTSSILKIPSSIDGHSVISLAFSFFWNDNVDNFDNLDDNKMLVNQLYIPDSVVTSFEIPVKNSIERLRLPNIGNKTQYIEDELSLNMKLKYTKKLILPGIPEGASLQNVSLNPDCSFDVLEELYFGEGTKGIYYANFSESLKSVAIPSSVTFIGRYGTSYYDDLGMKHTEDPVETNVFENCKNLTIICEKGSYAEQYAEKYGIKTKIVQ